MASTRVEGFHFAPTLPWAPSIVKRICRQLRQLGGGLFQCPIASPRTIRHYVVCIYACQITCQHSLFIVYGIVYKIYEMFMRKIY